ncbi:NUDIX pyrophosphatase [Burkholderia ubonensis]|uniref:dihydroneopterin triphosphate diphosphatase n=1 Tax=Burkholderia ubonensis TaxID=101571 RepID=UPI0007535A70|nr:dihydroneopterin triphosphate diphosphatase [Burkholderia ubonensis]KWD52927.1 NUDIX pyrophosphatase [Burkholderia ubonensis]KWD58358.1 NUDIX pyrophosphatase [Burkholderia ubonensis]
MTKPPKIPESVLVVIYTPDLDVLVIKRADQPDFWQSVTGSKDALDEPLAVTAAREVAEETGIVVGTLEVPASALVDWHHQIEYAIYPQYLHRYAPGVTRNTEHWFGLCVPRRVDVTLSPREHVDHAWLPYREAAARCFSPSNAEAILQLSARAVRTPDDRPPEGRTPEGRTPEGRPPGSA